MTWPEKHLSKFLGCNPGAAQWHQWNSPTELVDEVLTVEKGFTETQQIPGGILPPPQGPRPRPLPQSQPSQSPIPALQEGIYLDQVATCAEARHCLPFKTDEAAFEKTALPKGNYKWQDILIDTNTQSAKLKSGQAEPAST